MKENLRRQKQCLKICLLMITVAKNQHKNVLQPNDFTQILFSLIIQCKGQIFSVIFRLEIIPFRAKRKQISHVAIHSAAKTRYENQHGQ